MKEEQCHVPLIQLYSLTWPGTMIRSPVRPAPNPDSTHRLREHQGIDREDHPGKIGDSLFDPFSCRLEEWQACAFLSLRVIQDGTVRTSVVLRETWQSSGLLVLSSDIVKAVLEV